MTSRFRSSGGRKVTPPGPSFMDDNQLGQYLKDLRGNRPPRPNGSRPLPDKTGSVRSSLSAQKDDTPARAYSALSMSRPSDNRRSSLRASDVYPRSTSALSQRSTDPAASGEGGASGNAQEEHGAPKISRALSPTPTVMSNASRSPLEYRVSGQRWMEQEEARSLRSALEQMDMQDDEDEQRIHQAAQNEASELVMEHQKHGMPPKHQNPYAPFRNPDASQPNRLRSHLEKGSYSKRQSFGDLTTAPPPANGHRSASGSSNGSLHGTEVKGVSNPSRTQNGPTVSAMPQNGSSIPVMKNASLKRTQKVDFALPEEGPPAKREGSNGSYGRRRTASNDSSKGIFRNPEDYIYEEPEDSDAKEAARLGNSGKHTSVLTTKTRNSLPRGPRSPNTNGTLPERKSVQFRSDKGPSPQPHKPAYQSNDSKAPVDASKDGETVPTKDGIEIRGDDIREATSRRLKDRCPNLAKPSAVSDRPGRPIVSFDPNWKAEEEENEPSPAIEVTAPDAKTQPSRTSEVPTINTPGDDNATPAISISVSTPPPISNMESSKKKPSSKPEPTVTRPPHDPRSHVPSRRQDTSVELRGHPSLRSPGPTASCAACELPISGRLVTASSWRLHPECFSCHHCGTGLECVAFYEEPAAKREERLEASEYPDEDAKRPQFYCHLDFHELFSPRCKHCKTPIEGEVIVACGAEWHEGHFFCAECGDPFTSSTPFVEDSGYAWCVKCHSRRTASKCLGCKRPVLEEVVISALDGNWHQNCFACHECGGGFGPEGKFFVREGPPRVTAKGRQIGGPVQNPVCEGCESRRLRA